MSFNNFLFTSKDRDISLTFAESNLTNPDLIGILFVMTIDSSKSTTSFASINSVSYFQMEDEVLFSMHTVFRIQNIKPIDGNHQIFHVDLTLTSDNDKELHILTDCIRAETSLDAKGWFRFGLVLLRMGNSIRREKFIKCYLMPQQTTSKK
jgi:hypothetical protein